MKCLIFNFHSIFVSSNFSYTKGLKNEELRSRVIPTLQKQFNIAYCFISWEMNHLKQLFKDNCLRGRECGRLTKEWTMCLLIHGQLFFFPNLLLRQEVNFQEKISALTLSFSAQLTVTSNSHNCNSVGKESACNAGDPSSIPGSGRLLETGQATHSSIPGLPLWLSW